MKTILYKKAASSAMTRWTIYAAGNQLHIFWGQLGGIEQYQIVQVEVNQSGRSLEDQLQLELDSRVSKQLDKGYRYSIKEAEEAEGLNSLNMFKPMLAVRYSDVKHKIDVSKYLHQYKYNGHRCLVTSTGKGLMAYSRNGKVIDTVPHILAQLDLPIGATVDGELYLHGCRLQTISSYVKRTQPMTKNLLYVIYDVISNGNYRDRNAMIAGYIKPGATHVIEAPTQAMSGVNLAGRLTLVKNMGYEGIILRNTTLGYEPGVRSSSLIKVKSCFDDEYEVIDMEQSADGWAVLICEDNEGRRFKVSAPGTLAEKTHVWTNPDKYIGRYINVEYFELTERGVPFHAVATGWRNKNEE